MSVITQPRRIRQFPGFLSLPCSECGAAMLSHEADPRLPICRQCRRGEAEREIGKAANLIHDLINGIGECAVLNQIERQDKLAELGIDTRVKVSTVALRDPPDDVTREEIELVCAQMDQDAAEHRDAESFEQW